MNDRHLRAGTHQPSGRAVGGGDGDAAGAAFVADDVDVDGEELGYDVGVGHEVLGDSTRGVRARDFGEHERQDELIGEVLVDRGVARCKRDCLLGGTRGDLSGKSGGEMGACPYFPRRWRQAWILS